MYKKGFIHLTVFAILVFISFSTDYNPFVMKDVQVYSNAVQQISKNEDPLYKEIEQKSKKFSISPKNAVIDRVWKKMPGLNGRKVDIAKSYEKMKKKGNFDPSLLVYEQLPPKVSLQDLPPAPIYRGNKHKKMVSLLINVSWGTEHIPDILKILKKHHVKATFFLEGRWAKEHVDYVKMIAEQDHVIGNHAYNHPDMKKLSKSQIRNQIKQTNNIIEAILDKKPLLFAPPSGSFKKDVIQIAASLNMQTILWTVDTIDWRNPSVSVMVNRVKKEIHPGAMILMHPTDAIRNGLDQLITVMKEKGYQIGTVNELLSEKRL